MKQILLIIVFVILFSSIKGQQNNIDTIICQFAEDMPEYPGGDLELYKYIALNYNAPDNDCFVSFIRFSFVIEKDGTISNKEVIINNNNISLRIGNENIEVCKQAWIKAGLDLLNKMPNWISGKNNSENVRVKITIPLHLDPQ